MEMIDTVFEKMNSVTEVIICFLFYNKSLYAFLSFMLIIISYLQVIHSI